jgi:hypothetical protein
MLVAMRKLPIKAWLLTLVALATLTMLVLRSGPDSQGISQVANAASPEIARIKGLAGDTKAQSAELKKLLERVGPDQAQEEMLHSGLPFTGETHLLIHTVGEYIYDKYGPSGVSYCRDYFLSACYHAVIIDTLADFGLAGVATAMDNCLTAGPGVFPQCAHGAGHGFVAWHDYDLIKGAEMCDELGSKVELLSGSAAQFPYFNCYDGVFMENIWGVHGGRPSEKRWVKEGDLNYPCNDPRIPEKYLTGCWSNQATLIYQYFHGDLAKTAQTCDQVANMTYRNTCYDNLFRQIHPLTEGKTERVRELCLNATGIERQNECVLTNMVSYWSVGDHELPFVICDETMGGVKSQCFERLISMINYYYAHSPGELRRYCDKISDTNYRARCKNQSS